MQEPARWPPISAHCAACLFPLHPLHPRAGRGVVHSEFPAVTTGVLHGFQLWINLPAKDKMCKPRWVHAWTGGGRDGLVQMPGNMSIEERWGCRHTSFLRYTTRSIRGAFGLTER